MRPLNASGSWSCTGYMDGTICTMGCKAGFTGGYFIWCESGVYSAAAGGCWKATPTSTCVLPPSLVDSTPPNSAYDSWADRCPPSQGDGATCFMPCDSGYLGGYYVQCKQGAYSAVMGSCRKDKFCRGPPDSTALQNGAYESWSNAGCDGAGGIRPDGSYCAMGCKPSYTGGYTVQCQNGNWSAVMGSCYKDRMCRGYPNAYGLQNAAYDNWAYSCRSITSDGGFCELSCNYWNGYLGTYLAMCKQGAWVGLPGEVLAVYALSVQHNKQLS